jgi:hypothetical protein
LTAPARAAPYAGGRDEETALQPNKETAGRRKPISLTSRHCRCDGAMETPDLGQPQSFLVLFFKKELLLIKL